MLKDENRMRARTEIGVLVSTVFLGHEYEGNFFETMVIGGTMDGHVSYAPTITDAMSNHRELVAHVKRSIP